jgi:hypothetical protein
MFQLDNDEYTALVALARDGAAGGDRIPELEAFLRSIEKKNGVLRYFLMVRWQETEQRMPPTTRFPAQWPPQLQKTIERIDRPIARVDVEQLLATYATKPITVLVTIDPQGLLGWTEFDVAYPT